MPLDPNFSSDQLQGNILSPFAKDHQQYLFLRFPDDQAHVKSYLAIMADRVANELEVRQFNDLFKEINGRRRHEHGTIKATWVQLTLTASGLTKAGVAASEVQALSPALASGMRATAAALGDIGASDPTNWESPLSEQAFDAIILIASDDPNDLRTEARRMHAVAREHGIALLEDTLDGATLEGSQRGHEHFGFKDGISKPAIDDPTPFVIGSSAGTDPWGSSVAIPGWAVGSSLGVLRVLEQDVAGFRATMAAQAGAVGLTPSALAAKLLGRWQSGTSLARAPEADDRALADDNAFDYVDDQDGLKTPRFAHIRKVNPRSESPGPAAGEANKRTMLRRGIPYGKAMPDGAADDDGKRGLLFLAFMANIEQQFIFVQQRWCNDPNFPVGPTPTPASGYAPAGNETADGPDPIIGQPAGPVNLRSATVNHVLIMQQFVTTRGGEYLIALSIVGLKLLGGVG